MVGWKRKPDEIIGGEDNPYLLRWYLIPRNRFFNIYLHKFLRDDDDRALHCHPWVSLSISSSRYLEIIDPAPGLWTGTIIKKRRPFLPVFRRASHTHRIVLYRDEMHESIPFWTLFITGPRTREWGFLCPQGWRHWKEFCDEKDHGKIGRGCA